MKRVGRGDETEEGREKRGEWVGLRGIGGSIKRKAYTNEPTADRRVEIVHQNRLRRVNDTCHFPDKITCSFNHFVFQLLLPESISHPVGQVILL